MQTCQLGSKRQAISAICIRCIGTREFYGAGEDTKSLHKLDRALELGVNFLDTYGFGQKET